jgi:transposase
MDRLEQHMSAKEIARELEISRNAVYQQIQAMRKKGALSRAYTPSGQAPREHGAPVVLTSNDGTIATQLIEIVAQSADALDELAAQMREAIGQGPK